jgi:WhiB family transcriptional regulator, redox-sensing transcriptional regulator
LVSRNDREVAMARYASALQPLSDAWEWQLLGSCRDRSRAEFFHPDNDLGRISRRMREASAKRICGACPVRPQCATHALVVGEEYGVWGGFSESDRVLLNDMGWRDAIDDEHLADVVVLDRRIAVAREAARRVRDERARQAAGPGM